MATNPIRNAPSDAKTRSTPRLVAVAGPLRESVFALPESELSLGRDASNGLPIGAPSVSRRHCVIRREGSGFKSRDLASRNGTKVFYVTANPAQIDPVAATALGYIRKPFSESAIRAAAHLAAMPTLPRDADHAEIRLF